VFIEKAYHSFVKNITLKKISWFNQFYKRKGIYFDVGQVPENSSVAKRMVGKKQQD
jgi:hypothetical protein